MTNFHSRGQATIELLLVLAVLFIILGYAVQTFTVHQSSVNQKKNTLDTQRSAAILRTAIETVGYSPIGTTIRVFIPPTTQAQDISVVNGIITVSTNTGTLQVPSLFRDLNVGTVHDGNIVHVTKTMSGVIVT